jgi:hypothetical protein
VLGPANTLKGGHQTALFTKRTIRAPVQIKTLPFCCFLDLHQDGGSGSSGKIFPLNAAGAFATAKKTKKYDQNHVLFSM